MVKQILLLDLDGVLLESGAYHASLRRAVSLMGAALGYREVPIPQAAIDLFEAAGITCEWDSGAICTALLLDRAWTIHPDLTLPDSPPLSTTPLHDLEAPDFVRIAQEILDLGAPTLPPSARAERCLLAIPDPRRPEQIEALRNLLRQAHDIHNSITCRIIQELNLGSQTFHEAYGMPGWLDVESYLRVYDRPALPQTAREQLTAWSSVLDHHIAPLTNRPSRAPDGSGAPEAQIGVEVAGLGEIPLLATSAFAQESAKRGLGSEALLKPSAVHTLATLRWALGAEQVTSLASAAALALDGHPGPGWSELHRATVCVFEDSVLGLRSALDAQAALRHAGVHIDLRLYGIAVSEAKRKSLLGAGASVFPSLAAALVDCGILTEAGQPWSSPRVAE